MKKKRQDTRTIVHSLPSFLFLSSSSSSCFSSCQQSRAYTNSTPCTQCCAYASHEFDTCVSFLCIWILECAEWASPVGLFVTLRLIGWKEPSTTNNKQNPASVSTRSQENGRSNGISSESLRCFLGSKDQLAVVILWESNAGLKTLIGLVQFSFSLYSHLFLVSK